MFETFLKSLLVLVIVMTVLLNLPGFQKTAYMGNNGYAVSSQRFNAKIEANFDKAARQVKTYLPKKKFWKSAPAGAVEAPQTDVDKAATPTAAVKVQDAPKNALGPKTSLK